MVAKRHHDHEKIIEQCKALLAAGIKPEWRELADKIGLPSTTLQNIFSAHKIKHPRNLLDPSAGDIPTYSDLKEGDNILHTQGGAQDEYVSVSVSGQIKSVEDLVRVCKVDTEKYIILDPQFRKWDVTLKLRTNGEDDRVVVVPQIYISFKTIARNPEPVRPIIKPIQISFPAGFAKKKTLNNGGLRRALIVPDAHVGFRRRIHTQELTPFHDRRVLDIVAQILRNEPFDDILFIGDCMDFSEFSMKFTIEPEFYFTTQPALIEWAWWLAHYREIAPNAVMDQFEGNHDKRMQLMVVAYMRAAYALRPIDELEQPASLSTERLLALESMDINYIVGYPDNIKWLNQNVLVRHGDVARGGAGDSAKSIISKTTYTTIFGHIHRREFVSRRIKTRDGDIIQHAICPGCACRIDGVVPGSTSEQQWQQGLAVIEYTDELENIIPITIDNGIAIYNGKIYRAKDRNAEVDRMIQKSLEKIKQN